MSGASAPGVAAAASGLRIAARLLAEDVTRATNDGRAVILGHWSGLAALVAQGAIADQIRAVAVCQVAIEDAQSAVAQLAEAAVHAEALRSAAQRLAAEAGIDLDADTPHLRSGIADPGRAAEALAGVNQLLAQAAEVLAAADRWCCAQLAAIRGVAPPSLGTPSAIRPFGPDAFPGQVVDPVGPDLALLDLPPRLAKLGAARLPAVPFAPNAFAQAALSPRRVAADILFEPEAREIAAAIELADEIAAARPGSRTWSHLRTLAASGSKTFVYFDSATGHVAQVVGNLATARAVVIFVPGLGTSIDNWQGVSEDIENMYAALQATPGGDNVAVIGWLGSAAPSNLVEASMQKYARRGARQLTTFVDGLALPAATRLTVVGHSYGGVTAGLAVRAGLPADALVGVAAAGFGPGVNSTKDLRGTPTYVITNPKDIINEVQPAQSVLEGAMGFGLAGVFGGFVTGKVTSAVGIGHLGADPTRVRGAQRLTTDDDNSQPLVATGVDVHSRYFVLGGRTDEEIADVALGLPAPTFRGR